MNRIMLVASFVFLLAGASGRAAAQDQYAGMQGTSDVVPPSLTAAFVDMDKKAAAKSATVEVKVRDIKLVDPDSVHGVPHAGQGHIHYRLDNGPTVATTALKLSFHGLAAGTHVLEVSLAANDHSPLGTPVILHVDVP
jgi:hypothetical protein